MMIMVTKWDVKSSITIILDNDQTEMLRKTANNLGLSPVVAMEEIVKANINTLLNDSFNYSEKVQIHDVYCKKQTAGW